MRVKLVIVGIEGEANLGFILRLAKNFDVNDIVLVQPRIEIGEEVKRFAAKASDFVELLKIVSSLDEALENVDIKICTSAKVGSEKDLLRSVIYPDDLVKLYKRSRGVIGLVFGRESTGLTREELGKCDLIVNIPASPSYPVLNLSHSVGILLYLLYTSELDKRRHRKMAKKETIMFLLESYNLVLECLPIDEKKKERARIGFKRVMSKALLTDGEARTLAYILRKVWRKLECQKST